MRILKFHFPKYNYQLTTAWRVLRESKVSAEDGSILVFIADVLPDVQAFDDKLVVEWKGVAALKLPRNSSERCGKVFDLVEHKPVSIGGGFFVRFDGNLKPTCTTHRDTVVLQWETPPVIYSDFTPEFQVDRVEFNEDHAVVIAGLFSVKVTW